MDNLIPRPKQITRAAGFHSLPERITAHGPAWIESVLRTLNPALFPEITAVNGDAATVSVIAPDDVELTPTELPDASYRLEITPEKITVTCSQPAGLVAAVRTLGSMKTDAGFACASVIDSPRFRYRGLHLDVGRHFFTAEFVKRLIELLASLGFNVFHWHLTEDQGWRMPIDAYPELTKTGAYRTQDDGSQYGGSYTKREISDVVRFAGLHGVLVVPEIELPGHSRAAIAAYPALSCRQQPVQVWNRWGISDEVFCAGNDDVFAFLDDVFDEVAELFPSRYVHLGGDECPKARWKECPKCQARMREQGLANEEELQSYFVGRAARSLQARGRVAIGWDEILEGGLPEGTIVMSWRGTEGGKQAAAMDHDVIMTPTSHCYFDYRQIDREGELGFPIAPEGGSPPVLTLDAVYAFDPLAGLDEQISRHVLGGQANVWTEQMKTPPDVEYMIAPRILAMAEALWSPAGERDFNAFKARAAAWMSRLDAINWNYATVPELTGER